TFFQKRSPKTASLGLLLSDPLLFIPLFFGALRSGLEVALFPPQIPDSSLEERIGELGISLLVTERSLSLPCPLLSPKSALEEQGFSSPFLTGSTLLFTSGSSGKPKAAKHLCCQHLTHAERMRTLLDLREDDRYLLSLPLHHIA